jgi:hypothetical protein
LNHHSVHAAIEVAHKYGKGAEGGLKTVRAIAASEAFRKYNWLKNAPVRNVSGNFRGMVISKDWANLYHITEDVLKPAEKVMLLAALAENVVKARHQIDAILESRDPWELKAARLSTQVSSIALRTASGAIPAGAHIIAMSLGGYCQIAGLAGLRSAPKLDQKLKEYDAWVSSWYQKVTDGENISIFISHHLVIR